MRFKGKSVIVTGGASGIGKACAEQFAREGANIAIADLIAGDVVNLAGDLKSLGASNVLLHPCDVSKEADVLKVCDKTGEEFGGLDVVVNVAGMMIYKAIEDLTYEDWTRLFSVNFMGAALFTREAFKRMSGGGAIVNVSSIHACQTSPLVAPYAAAKAALTSLTRSSAIEGVAKGIRANAVLPGAIDTPMLWASPNIKSGVETIAPGDIGLPVNVADAVVFLASTEAAFITGTSLNVDGGRLAKL